MKNNSKILVALAMVGVAAIVVTIARRIDTKRILTKISDEGYETAHDVLYPGKDSTGSHLHYGPILPA
jgi:hypothetical protein